jgi:hypothetical protein
MRPTDAIAAALDRLIQQGGSRNRLVLSRGPAWLAYTGARGDPAIRCEAAPSSLLPKDRKLTAEQVHLLRKAGFASRPGSRGLGRDYRLGEGEEAHHPVKVADDALSLLAAVYGGDPKVAVEIEERPGDRNPTENTALIDAIRVLSKSRDDASRQAMYRNMARGRFLLPIEADGAPRVFGDLTGWPVYGVFTDEPALERWDPRGTRYEVLHARQLFPRLARLPLGSLLINPDGQIGGELYRNEVEMLAAAIR